MGALMRALFNWRGLFGRQDAEKLSGEDIRSVLGHLDAATDAVIKIAIESWRFGRIFEKTAVKLKGAEHERCMNQLLSFNKKIENSLEALGLRMVNIEGTPFDPGIAATPLNIADFKADDELVVDRMIEPIIMGKDGLIRVGRVTLRKMER
ncbi:MAG: hypothetical protein LBS53_05675 [Synergistaceae bacterium]|nr:hypothetical protein [Synergistaceae bacterium]